jgi:hypothetical protein
VISDFTETLGFLERTGMNEITAWGLFTDEGWEPEIEKTIDSDRKKTVKAVLRAAHERHIKVLCGMGIYSWGFGKILRQYPDLGCPGNPAVMDLSKPGCWEWQKKVLDYVMDNFEFDGFSLQSGDHGWCKSGSYADLSAMQYHAVLNQKVVTHIRSRKPGYIIGISGWGMDFSDPNDLDAIYEMTKNLDYLIDVNETALYGGKGYRAELIAKIAPCLYGNTAIPNIEPIQAIDRSSYFIPTVFSSCGRLKQIWADGGRACEAYARTRGNQGDLVTVEAVARLLSDPGKDINEVLKDVLSELYSPATKQDLDRLAWLFRKAEKAFFDYAFRPDTAGHDDMVILLLPRDSGGPDPDYFDNMDPAARATYAGLMKQLLEEAEVLRPAMRKKDLMDILITSISKQYMLLVM